MVPKPYSLPFGAMEESNLLEWALFHTVSEFSQSLRLANAVPMLRCRLIAHKRKILRGFGLDFSSHIAVFNGPHVQGRITCKNYATILVEYVDTMVHCKFSNNDDEFQDDYNSVHTSRIVQDWFCERERDLPNLPWTPQSINIIESLVYSS